VAENAEGSDGCRIAGIAPVFAQVTKEDDENSVRAVMGLA